VPELTTFSKLGPRQQQRRVSQVVEAIKSISGAEELDVVVAAVHKRLTNELPVDQLKEQLMHNVHSTLSEMTGNGGKGGFAARVLDGIPTEQAARLGSCSPRTIQRARNNQKQNPAYDAVWKQHPARTRKRIGAGEQKAVEDWLYNECPVRSGTKYHMQYCNSTELYDKYKAAAATGRIRWAIQDTDKDDVARTRPVFDRIKGALPIRVSSRYWGQFNCSKCGAVKEEKKNLAKLQRERKRREDEGVADEDGRFASELAGCLQRVEDTSKHQQIRQRQHAYLMQCRHDTIESDRGRILVIMDFSKFNLDQNITETVAEKKGAPDYVHDMIQVMEYWRPAIIPSTDEKQEEEKEEKKEEKKEEEKKKRGRPRLKKPEGKEPARRQVRYYDNLCRDPGIEGNDTAYVRMAMRNAITCGYFDGFTRVDLFTDGGPKHYKSVYGMYMMSQWYDWWAELRPGVAVPELVWNFTAPYHGHGVADSHAGIFSQMLTRKKNEGQHGGGPEAVGGGPRNVDEVSQLMEKMKDTSVHIFETIERKDYRFDMRSLDAIRQHFQFRFPLREVMDWDAMDEQKKRSEANDCKEEKQEQKNITKIVRVVQYRRESSDTEVVEGDAWCTEEFQFTGKQSKATKRPKRERDTIDATDEPAATSLSSTPITTSSSSSAAINGVRSRAKKMHKAATQKNNEKNKASVPRKTAKPKSKKSSIKSIPSAPMPSSQVVARAKPKSKSRGQKMVEVAVAAEPKASRSRGKGKTTKKATYLGTNINSNNDNNHRVLQSINH
jgi:hypothetical protein